MNPNIYRQGDPRWASLAYPKAPSTIATDGCGLLSVTHCAIERKEYYKSTPKTFYSFMKQYAVFDNGTEWAGIDAGLDKYIGNHKRHYDMASFWEELGKGNRVGVILFGKGTAPDGTIWTYGGHYVAFVNYKYENGQHWLYTKDSNGNRMLDGWRAYEKSIKGCIPDVMWSAVLPGWYQVGSDWYFYHNDGTMAKNEWAQDGTKKWCYLGPDGKMLKGQWLLWKGAWYYLKPDGYMASNEWAKDRHGWCYLKKDGEKEKNAWVYWKNHDYYIKPDGYMATGELAVKCKFDENGKLVATV